MKVPLSWLKEFVHLDATPEEIADALTFSGTEVENISRSGGGLGDIIVAEIVELAKHPNADRLRVCKVNDGTQIIDVVCGASNFDVGDKAAFAPVGAVLPGGMKIKRSKIRGEVSLGMLCAEDELELSDGHDGIMLFERTVDAGTPISSLLPPEDTVLTLEITWNRPDLLSIIGIARELSAVFKVPYQVPEPEFTESDTQTQAGVTIADDADCTRYTARVVEGVSDGPSPAWMQRRLELCGVRAISCLVDITNYVLLECGQPLHAFDYDQIGEHRIDVRLSHPGETFSTLDGVERIMPEGTTLITDAKGPVAIAGVMGGAGSEITSSTCNILLESATFNAPAVRRASSALSLSSESSHRFERGVEQALADWGSRRAAMLLQQLCGGRVCGGVVDVSTETPEVRQVLLRFESACGLLGMTIPNEDMVSILKRLEFDIVSQDGQQCTVGVPDFRHDITREADLIEEIARMHGLDELPDVLPSAVLSPHADDRAPRAVMQAREVLKALGMTEIINYSFLSDAALDVFDPDDTHRLRLPNPVSGDFATMRPSLIPQVVETLGRNFSYQNEDAAVYEIGTVFSRDADGGQSEARHLCIGLMGHVGRANQMDRSDVDAEEMMSWIRGAFEAFTDGLRLRDLSYEPCAGPEFEPQSCLRVMIAGKACGHIGLIARHLCEKWRMTGFIGLVEVELGPVLSQVYEVPQVRRVVMYPAIRRDLALLVDEAVTHEDISKTIRRVAPDELTRIDLFDIFRSSGIGEGRKSLAYSLTYRSSERTLTDDEANGFDSVIVSALTEAHGAEIRDA